MSEHWSWRFLEVIALLIIIGAVGAMAVPKSAELKRRDAGAKVLADVDTFKAAVYAFYSDSAYFPAQRTDEAIPASLVPYLPPSLGESRSYGTLQYHNWPMRDTLAGAGTSMVGLTVIVTDSRVGAEAAARALTVPKFVVGNRYTFLLFGS